MTVEIGTPNKKHLTTPAIPSLLHPAFMEDPRIPGLAISRLANGSHRHPGLSPDGSTRFEIGLLCLREDVQTLGIFKEECCQCCITMLLCFFREAS